MCPAAKICGGAFLFMKFFKDNGLNVFSMKTLAVFLSKRSYAPHQSVSRTAFPPRGSLEILHNLQLSYSALQKRAVQGVRVFPDGSLQIVNDRGKTERDTVMRRLSSARANYIRERYNALMSSSVGSFGLPGRQASSIADCARKSTSLSLTICLRS